MSKKKKYSKKKKPKKIVKKRKKRKSKKSVLKLPFVIVALLLAFMIPDAGWDLIDEVTTQVFQLIDGPSVHVSNSELAQLEFDGIHQVVEVNGNRAEFTEEELSLAYGSWQTFSDLDRYNRVGPANAMLSRELMPTEPRESLYVNPTGWKNKQITIDGKTNWLYNRCHLIGFQLTGENNNLKNLMTGTRSLNVPHMLNYENIIANYLKETNHHIRYRVEPIFKENELVARGIQMQAQSVESNEINFNVFIFNIENGVEIDYTDGSSKLVK